MYDIQNRVESLNNPLLEDMRGWIRNRSLRVTGIGRRKTTLDGTLDYETFMHMNHRNAHFLLTGLQIVDALANNPTPQQVKLARRIFGKSNAHQGWDSKQLASGNYAIFSNSTGWYIHGGGIKIQPYEAEAITNMSILTKYYLDRI